MNPVKPVGAAISLCLALMFSGCQHSAPVESGWGEDDQCRQVLEQLDRRIEAAGEADAGVPRIAGFPWLRTNRFLEAALDRADTDAGRAAWLQRSGQLAVATLVPEASRLPGEFDYKRVVTCLGHVLAEPVSPAAWSLIRQRAAVPDSYKTWQRVAGLYPLMALPFRAGVVRDQREFQQRADDLAATEQSWQDYVPRLPVSVPVRLADVARDALGVPVLTARATAALLAEHAPAVSLPGSAPHDRIVTPMVRAGHPNWADAPTFFTFVDHGFYRGQVTVRLNYVFWFPARPATGGLDLLAGRFDGLTFRVHLDAAGDPIAWDAVHNCGCWYQLYPAAGHRVQQAKQAFAEPILVGRTLETAARKQLLLEGGTHALLAVRDWSGNQSGAVPLRPYADLKQLRSADAVASLFDRHGLVPTSARLERFVFWPMGIRSAGQMRVAGTQAIAFVGRRHFDDPDLLERAGLEPMSAAR